jgi:hypothetical protein
MKGSSYSLRVMKNAKQFQNKALAAATLEVPPSPARVSE